MSSSLTGTGEEWKALDITTSVYSPSDTLLSASKASIEKIRKRNITLRFVDRKGKPLAHTPITIAQQKSAFKVGDQLWGMDRLHRLGQWNTDIGRYHKRRHAELFNAATALCYWTERPRNDGPKSEDIQGEPQYESFAAMVDWANSERLAVKGHPLFWSIQKCVPDWVKRYDYETQMKFAEVRIRSLVARFKGKIDIWDAVNEPMWEPAFKNLPDRDWPHLDPVSDVADYIEPILRWCREEDPDATFLINDYGLEKDSPNGAPKAAAPASMKGTPTTAALQRKRLLQLIAELQQRGTPPSAIGMQAHTGGWLDHETQLAVYDELATSGLPLHVTEFWAGTGHLKDKNLPKDVIQNLEADFICNYLTVAYGHPALDAFFFWGAHPINWFEGKDSSHELLPIYHKTKDLLKNQWMTNLTEITNADGLLSFRGFFGDYSARYPLAKTPTKNNLQGTPFTLSPHTTEVLTIATPHHAL